MLVDNSGGAAAVNLGNECVGGGGGSDSAGGDDGDRNSAGNRWPREETLVLLQVRQSMDEAFRDSNLKAPLWDEVSRKLGEHGYTRSAKKCKEKFENIYKYHRRTKEGKSGRQDGKNYRYFEQLEIFDNQSSYPINQDKQTYLMEQTTSMPKPTSGSVMMAKPVSQVPHGDTPNPSFELMDTSTSTTSSSGRGHVKKKRKLIEYFNGLMRQVLERQENLQQKFIEAIEKLEKDRMNREEEWRAQQLATKKREQGILAHERSAAAAKDAAILSFLQKISEQSPPLQLPISTPLEKILSMPQPQYNIRESSPVTKSIVHYSTGIPSSRWPKAEVEALITVRENLDMQYSDSGSKGSVWEEVSSAMARLGYDRSSKRCKEKWENINKYYRRVKESNKKRRQDSKTCPYFDMLESLYQRRSKKFDHSTSDSSGCNLKPEDILMQMIGHQREQVILESTRKGIEKSENVNRTPEDEDVDDDDDDDDDDVRDDEMDVEYHVVANKNPSEAIAEQ